MQCFNKFSLLVNLEVRELENALISHLSHRLPTIKLWQYTFMLTFYL